MSLCSCAAQIVQADPGFEIGNMVSAASSQIEATGGENNQIPNPRYNPASPGKQKPTIPDYALVSGILLGVVCAYLICVVVFGREYRGASFEEAVSRFRVQQREQFADIERSLTAHRHASRCRSGTEQRG